MTWDELAKHRVVIYTTAWCGDCRRLKAQLDRHGVPYREVDIDSDAEAARHLQERTGRQAIPFVEIDGNPHLIPGWHEDRPGRWDEAVFLAAADHAIESSTTLK